MRVDVIYLDFAEAFDSVDYDLILSKLMHCFCIDGSLLEFIKQCIEII